MKGIDLSTMPMGGFTFPLKKDKGEAKPEAEEHGVKENSKL